VKVCPFSPSVALKRRTTSIKEKQDLRFMIETVSVRNEYNDILDTKRNETITKKLRIAPKTPKPQNLCLNIN